MMAEGLVLSMVLTSHIGWQGNLNDVHPTVSYVYNSYSVGAFRNSLNHTSLFVSKTNEFKDFSIQYGFASNYDNRVVPMVIARKPLADHINFMISPSYNKTESKPGIILGFEFSF